MNYLSHQSEFGDKFDKHLKDLEQNIKNIYEIKNEYDKNWVYINETLDAENHLKISLRIEIWMLTLERRSKGFRLDTAATLLFYSTPLGLDKHNDAI